MKSIDLLSGILGSVHACGFMRRSLSPGSASAGSGLMSRPS